MRNRTAAIVALLAAVVLHGEAAAQLAISPPLVVLSEAERIGSFTVRNPQGSPQEVTIDFRFGYPRSDSLGKVGLVFSDSGAAERFSMTPWIRAFPRQFVIPPGGEQVVRLMVRPPSGLADGMYWTRLVTASGSQSQAVGAESGEVSAQIALRFEQVTAVLYRSGAAHAGVEVGEAMVRVAGEQHYLLVPLTATGNAPFLGTAALTIRNAAGTVVHETADPVAVYFDLLHRVELPPDAREAGSYSVDVRLTTERGDLPAKKLPRMAPVDRRVGYRLP